MIVVTVRTRNEAQNIEKFCKSYWWADKIVVSDGGSEDDTVAIAKQFKNVVLHPFYTKVYRNGEWRNPHGLHLNHMIRIAENYDAEWIIHDDCDCTPNQLLQKEARDLFESKVVTDFVYVTRLYLTENGFHYPDLAKPSGDWTPSLWAWRAETKFKFSENDPYKHTFTEPSEHAITRLMPPYCLLHNPWPDEETIQKKLTFYDKIYEQETQRYYGNSEKLPEWAK